MWWDNSVTSLLTTLQNEEWGSIRPGIKYQLANDSLERLYDEIITRRVNASMRTRGYSTKY